MNGGFRWPSGTWTGKADIAPADSPARNIATMSGDVIADAYFVAHDEFVEHRIKDILEWAR